MMQICLLLIDAARYDWIPIELLINEFFFLGSDGIQMPFEGRVDPSGFRWMQSIFRSLSPPPPPVTSISLFLVAL